MSDPFFLYLSVFFLSMVSSSSLWVNMVDATLVQQVKVL